MDRAGVGKVCLALPGATAKLTRKARAALGL